MNLSSKRLIGKQATAAVCICSRIHRSDWGDKVNSCIGLTLSPSHGSMNSAAGNKEERDTRDASGKETDEGRSAS
jgi:hypothetical protein